MSRRSNQRDSVSSDANSNVNKNTQGIVISRKPGVDHVTLAFQASFSPLLALLLGR